MRPPANSYVSKPSWKQLPQAPGQVFRLLQPQDYVNILFLLKVFPINFSIHQWVLFATIITQYSFSGDFRLPFFCLHLLTGILL